MAYKDEAKEEEKNPLAQEQKITATTEVKVETKPEIKVEPQLQVKQPQVKAEVKPQPQPQADPDMKELRVELKNPTKLNFIICNTGERNTRMVHDAKFILTKGVIFKIPLTDKTLNYASANLIRLVTPCTENFRILDVVDGVATVEPIVHGSFVEDNLLLGYMY
jgi:hypothetical protein